MSNKTSRTIRTGCRNLEVFRENFQAEWEGLSILVRLEFRLQAANRSFACEPPEAELQTAFRRKLSDCAFRRRRDNAGLNS